MATPRRPAPRKNCMCKVMDEGLRPVCEKEKQLKELADRHSGDDDAMEEIEIMQEEIEIMKDDISDVFYSMADVSDEFHADLEDELDDMDDDANSALQKLFINGGLRLLVKDQVGSTTRYAERRGRECLPWKFLLRWRWGGGPLRSPPPRLLEAAFPAKRCFRQFQQAHFSPESGGSAICLPDLAAGKRSFWLDLPAGDYDTI